MVVGAFWRWEILMRWMSGFLRLRRGAQNKGTPAENKGRPREVVANHVGACRIQSATVILFVHLGTHAMQHDFTICSSSLIFVIDMRIHLESDFATSLPRSPGSSSMFVSNE
jgi:hypothetical protein